MTTLDEDLDALLDVLGISQAERALATQAGVPHAPVPPARTTEFTSTASAAPLPPTRQEAARSVAVTTDDVEAAIDSLLDDDYTPAPPKSAQPAAQADSYSTPPASAVGAGWGVDSAQSGTFVTQGGLFQPQQVLTTNYGAPLSAAPLPGSNDLYGMGPQAPIPQSDDPFATPWEMRWTDLQIFDADELPMGVFGQVTRALWQPVTSTDTVEVCLKRWKFQRLDPEFLARFRQDVPALRTLTHPNLVALHGVCTFEGLYCGWSWLPGAQSLSDFLRSDAPLDGALALRIASGVASALAFLHAHNVIHGSLKPTNVLLDGFLHPHVTGYGFACVKDEVRASGQLFEIEYWAPELLAREAVYTYKIDNFAFGVLFNEIWSRQPPYAVTVVPRVIVAGVVHDNMRPKIDPSTPPACARLIQAAWAQVPEQRPEMSKIEAILSQPPQQLLGWGR